MTLGIIPEEVIREVGPEVTTLVGSIERIRPSDQPGGC